MNPNEDTYIDMDDNEDDNSCTDGYQRFKGSHIRGCLVEKEWLRFRMIGRFKTTLERDFTT